MADNQSIVSTSVAPSESVSQTGSERRKRPGKNQRAAAKASMPQAATANTGQKSVDGQFAFRSSAASIPIPQPGKFPIVFPTGAGEPTRDSEFSYDPCVINDTFNDISDRFRNAPRFAEFTEHTGYDDEAFDRDVLRFSLLGLAQQTVFSHVNMGLPLGDFSAVSSTDTFAFSSLRSIISQFGEFSVPSTGTRFLLANYASTVSSLVYAASRLTESAGNNRSRVKMLWLPMSAKDTRTKHIVATRLYEVLLPLGADVPVSVLASALFEKKCPQFEAVKTLLSGEKSRFDFLFKEMPDIAAWVEAFKPPAASGVLTELRLSWPSPIIGDLNWNFVPKVTFPELVDVWARKKAAFSKFFSLSSGLAGKSEAHGSPTQLSTVRQTSGVTIVQTLVAVSAPEFSLAACFPPSACTQLKSGYNVVLTTPVSVKVRATEFTQLDWLN